MLGTLIPVSRPASCPPPNRKMSSKWQAIEAIGACVAAVATFINVVFFRRYLKLTRGIHEAAIDQAEGQSQPVIVVACQRALPQDDKEWLQETIPTPIEGDTVRLTNIGNGPAFNLKWSYELEHGVLRGHSAYLPPSEDFVLGIPLQRGVGEKIVECEYDSRSGTRYVSTTRLRDTYVVASSIRKVGQNT